MEDTCPQCNAELRRTGKSVSTVIDETHRFAEYCCDTQVITEGEYAGEIVTTGYDCLSRQLAARDNEIKELKAGYRALDKNWSTLHNTCMDAIRAVTVEDGTVDEIACYVKRLRVALEAHCDHVIARQDDNSWVCIECGKVIDDNTYGNLAQLNAIEDAKAALEARE